MYEAIVAIGENKRIVGRLRFEADGRRQHSQFEYDEAWISAKDAFALSPGLPLRLGGHYASGSRGDERNALHGCFSDASPDSWGRALMSSVLGRGLTEYDYLTQADDKTRQGALRFLGNDFEPLAGLSSPVSRLIDLNELQSLSAEFERDGGSAVALRLAGLSGSLGGARPKANVESHGQLWIAKFTSERDTKPIERAEVATLKLAERCGLHVSNARLEIPDSDRPIALVERFDRHGTTRIPYISARTALQWDSQEGAYYTDIADVIRQISREPLIDLRELWKRLVFTILVSNTDDHLKNHGFVYSGRNLWRLSPAFDINPSPDSHRILATGIMSDEPFDAPLSLALEASFFFDIDRNEALKVAKEIAEIITRNWRNEMKSQGMSSKDLKLYEPAFEHDDTEAALAL